MKLKIVAEICQVALLLLNKFFLISHLLKTLPGLPFKQLQRSQQATLPWQIFGGIKGRKMNDAHTLIRLEIDHAKSAGSHTLGVKLDKSKCFDRLIPAVTAALFLVFGLNKGISIFFTDMYLSFHRYMNNKDWTSSIPTTITNQIAQGCCFGLLTINLRSGARDSRSQSLTRHVKRDGETFVDCRSNTNVLALVLW